MYRIVCRSKDSAKRLSNSRWLVLFIPLLPLIGIVWWLFSAHVPPVYSFTVDWVVLGWPYTAADLPVNGGSGIPPGPGTQSFTNVDGTGVDIDVNYSGFTLDDDSPYIYETNAPVPPLQTSLRWSNNGDDNGISAPGTAFGPTYMEFVFSQPVLIDSFMVGSLSELLNRFEWAVVTAYDEFDNPVLATGFITGTHDVDASGAYQGIIDAGGPVIEDAGGGVYRARGVNRQDNCDVGCGYDFVHFEYQGTPITRIFVQNIATIDTAFTSNRSPHQISIVAGPITFSLPGGTPTPAPAAIGNYVWLDEDANGRQDTGEPGIPNVVVNLTDSGNTVYTTTTDVDGGYLFGDLTAGTYTVTIPALNGSPGNALEGMAQSTNPVLPGADFGNQTLPYQVTIAAGDENLTADFGYVPNPDDVNNNTNNAALGDRVWQDLDSDGVQDPGELGIANVTLNLIGPGPDGLFFTGDDVTLGTDVTDANGRYLFTNLTPGAYVVRVDDTTLPAGYSQTGDPDDFGQPAASPDDQTTASVVLAPGDLFVNADFGYNPGSTP
ncbi:MAG: carboxypeptidase regulatory-like domain-containing protein, partial [Anaerolineales bacterium]|nr:carboxypeptidase regulatory-like domain-containing protein [Anaerolineales bacterium]